MASSTGFASSSSSRLFDPQAPSISIPPPPRPRPAVRSSSSPATAQGASGPRPSHTPHGQHYRTPSSSSLLQFVASSSFAIRATSPPPTVSRRVTPSTPPESPRFSRLLTSVLGSPFLTTSDLPQNSGSVELDMLESSVSRRISSSPTPSMDFSIIDVDPDDSDTQFSSNTPIPGSYPTRRSRHWNSHSHSRSFSSSVAGMNHSIEHPRGTSDYNPVAFANGFNEPLHSTPPRHGISLQNPFKSLLPRIWDAISSPGRAVLNISPSTGISPSNTQGSPASSRTASPSPRPVTPLSQSWLHATVPDSERQTPVFWSQRRSKIKSRATGFFARNASGADLNEYINYSELAPLDDEEGELIDDEACFIDVRAVTGIDILNLLPPELALHILMLLCPPPLHDSTTSSASPTRDNNSSGPDGSPSSNPQSGSSAYSGGSKASGRSSLALSPVADQEVALHAILACRSVSHAWRRLASDNAVWRALFMARWGIDLERATPEAMLRPDEKGQGRKTMGATWDYDWGLNHASYIEYPGFNVKGKQPVTNPLFTPLQRRYDGRDRSRYLSPRRISYITSDDFNPLWVSPLQLDWRLLYRERLELDMRWTGNVPVSMLVQSRQRSPSSPLEISDLYNDREMWEGKENIKPWEPELRRMEGHSDSVYCLEFDSQRIMTGSRDRTVKVWSLKTGQVLGTFRGVHRGSVLCLKFELDWDRDEKGGASTTSMKDQRKGMLVSGSSDCSICVWDLELGSIVSGTSDREVRAEVRAILKGHEGGVLDLRMGDRWIVSCSKDASIRVWDRNTLEPVRVLRGHEGPVNAIGFQEDRVVSASGDGKMILWDITNGERIRTFEGHDRGLACIEFKDNLIVSGSNDCKIKVWNPWTGECLRTLVGHDALVRALSFDPRTGRLVSVSYDKTVKVWDLRSGKLVREFGHIHSSHIFDVKFDVARIVTTSHDHHIIHLDFSAGLDTSLFI